MTRQGSTIAAVVIAAGCLSAATTRANAADLASASLIGAAMSSPADFYAFYVRIGPVALIPDASARISTPLGRLPGATIKIAPQVTAQAEVGYRFTPNWAASVSFGVPPTATIDGAGILTPLGRLGAVAAGPIALTGHYHFTSFGPLQPYVGGGPVYLISFDSRDGAISNLAVHSAFGVTAQVGADYMITDRLGLYVDLKKAYLRTTARGALGAVPIRGDLTLDPYAVSGGLTYRF